MRCVRASLVSLIAACTLSAAALADDPCDGERAAANAGLARAKAAKASGNLRTALKLLNEGSVRVCADGADEFHKEIHLALGREAEAAGKRREAHERYWQGGHNAEARRVGLAELAAAPTDRGWATEVMRFMRNTGDDAGIAEVAKHARGQAQRLLAEEDKSFAIRTPHRELLDNAQAWLQLAGDDDASDVRKRALRRGDEFATLDYHYALSQAIGYYDMAGRPDKQEEVRKKARRIADQLAGGDNWRAAVDLYDLSGDSERAEALSTRREASAAETEATRQERFKKEQDDLEKELGF